MPVAVTKLLRDIRIRITEVAKIKQGQARHAKNGIHNLHINSPRIKSIQNMVPQGIITIAEIQIKKKLFGAIQQTQNQDGNIAAHYLIKMRTFEN